MIGTISIECNAKNPNMPLHPLRAYVNSPSSLRIINVPKKIGNWQIKNVTLSAVYPDGSNQTASCVLVGGVWVGTIAGSTLAGSNENGYTIYASGVDENGLDVEGYVLGKGDVVVLDASGQIPENAIQQLSAEVQNKRDYDDMCIPAQPSDTTPIWFGEVECDWDSETSKWKSSDGLVVISRFGSTDFYDVTAYSQLIPEAVVAIQARVKLALPTYKAYVKAGGSSPDIEVRSFDGSIATESYVDEAISNISGELDLSAYATTEYVDSVVSGKADVSSLNDYYTKNETSSATQLETAFNNVSVDLSEYYTKSETSSAVEIQGALDQKADVSSLNDYYTKSETSSSIEIQGALDKYAPLSAIPDSYDKIQDADGNAISANRMATYEKDGTPYWNLVFNGITYRLEGTKERSSYFTEAPWYDGEFQGVLSWDLTNGRWMLSSQAYDAGIGVWAPPEVVYDADSGHGATSLHFDYADVGSCEWTTPTAPATERLATEEWVQDEVRYANFAAWSTTLEDRAVQLVKLEVSATTLVLPELAYPNKTQDFVLDVVNAYSVNGTSTSATFALSGTIGTNYFILVPDGESFADMTTLEADEMAEFYFTKTAFQLSSLPTWKVVKQKVETYTPETI